MNKSLDEVLLIHHKKLNKLIQPGGHCEAEDYDVKMAALRELIEESGLSEIKSMNEDIFNIDIHQIPERLNEAKHIHYDICYLFVCDSTEVVMKTEEVIFAKWFKLSELEHMMISDNAVLNMIKKTKRIMVN